MYQNTVPCLEDIQDFSFNRLLTTHEQHLIRPRVKCEAKGTGLRAAHLSSFHNSKDHCPQKLFKKTNDVSNKYSLSIIMLLSSLSNKGAHHSAFSEMCENPSRIIQKKKKRPIARTLPNMKTERRWKILVQRMEPSSLNNNASA